MYANNYGSTRKIYGCEFIQNSGNDIVLVFGESANALISRTSFFGNDAFFLAISQNSASLVFDQSTFTSNTVTILSAENVTMISITQNQFVLYSSVIESNGSSSMIVILNQFINNSARFSILAAANVTTLSITHNQFDNNA